MLLLVNDQQPYKTVKDFIDDAKKRPEAIIYSSGGFYGASHLPMAMLEKAAGLPKLRHLPTNGGGPAIMAMLGNNAQASDADGVGDAAVHQGRQAAPAGVLRRAALEGAARRADDEGARLRRRILSVGRPVRAEGHARRRSSRRSTAAIDKAASSDLFTTAIANIGLEPGYLDAADFAKFWDLDAKRSEDAVKSIGRVQG